MDDHRDLLGRDDTVADPLLYRVVQQLACGLAGRPAYCHVPTETMRRPREPRVGGFWRSSQQEIADQLDWLLEP